MLKLLLYTEVARVLNPCHPVSSVRLRVQTSSCYSKAKWHRSICESKKALTLLGSTTETNERAKQGGAG